MKHKFHKNLKNFNLLLKNYKDLILFAFLIFLHYLPTHNNLRV